MKTLRTAALISAAMVAIACGKDSSKSAINGDLKRDLELAASSATDLASAQRAAAFSPSEIAPSSAPQKTRTLRKSAGPKVVRTKRPTVKASALPVDVAQAEVPDVQMTEAAPVAESSPSPTTDADIPAMPRPTPAQIPSAIPAGQGSGQGNSTGSGIGAVLGGIFGVVIRGGGVDGDRCEPHGRYPGRRPSTGGVYQPSYPNPIGGVVPRGRIYVRQR